VRCRYCGYRVKVNLERRVLYRDWEDAVRAASG
jgi:DNA-directed RNA polymerase subunit RPC12/RpoP